MADGRACRVPDAHISMAGATSSRGGEATTRCPTVASTAVPHLEIRRLHSSHPPTVPPRFDSSKGEASSPPHLRVSKTRRRRSQTRLHSISLSDMMYVVLYLRLSDHIVRAHPPCYRAIALSHLSCAGARPPDTLSAKYMSCAFRHVTARRVCG
jgi:hypothetical protein